jgi:hypothetical protein
MPATQLTVHLSLEGEEFSAAVTDYLLSVLDDVPGVTDFFGYTIHYPGGAHTNKYVVDKFNSKTGRE